VVDEDLAIGAVSEALDPCQGAYRDGEGLLEGDGWVNWSGLAGLVAEVALDHLHEAGRLMQLVGTCDTQLSRASRTVA
jgi:hypothetical protein